MLLTLQSYQVEVLLEVEHLQVNRQTADVLPVTLRVERVDVLQDLGEREHWQLARALVDRLVGELLEELRIHGELDAVGPIELDHVVVSLVVEWLMKHYAD
jgi:hypothetical protein